MSVFQTYLQLGFYHIFNLGAYDHMVFLLALCAPYVLRDWKPVVALVTSFTVGHSLTLALSTMGVVNYSPKLIEILIPITILLTCLANLLRAGHPTTRISPNRRETVGPLLLTLPNLLAVAFGLIHGLGFSSYLRELLGHQSRPVLELLAFNIGVELGQLLIVSLILLLGLIVLRIFNAARRDWLLVTSGAALGIALVLLLGQI
ncbi:HupE/UreJ family protein [Hymenobacter taeanensis]|uniref:HupE/UreJ family protein n=1 Tax=Hymenobacter taeanensis TaxID=2735321 RepID=A0A6M6BJ23_9BACT|nr:MULTISPECIES: HupE/UreJ family protein [Hymenobacter]QJX47323.1 HupE/UreJ family protein [Hymenobacter taeanensis]UOQ79340.1 HupE/UreJ family protein [Hymenobacter sp. 5414T-23]